MDLWWTHGQHGLAFDVYSLNLNTSGQLSNNGAIALCYNLFSLIMLTFHGRHTDSLSSLIWMLVYVVCSFGNLRLQVDFTIDLSK